MEHETQRHPGSRRHTHLYPAQAVAQAIAATRDDTASGRLRRGHREGNGVRVNTIYFVAVSVTALAVVLLLIGLASGRA